MVMQIVIMLTIVVLCNHVWERKRDTVCIKRNHLDSFKPCPAELFQIIYQIIHLKLELLTQFPASNDEKHFYLWKINISQNEIFD